MDRGRRVSESSPLRQAEAFGGRTEGKRRITRGRGGGRGGGGGCDGGDRAVGGAGGGGNDGGDAGNGDVEGVATPPMSEDKVPQSPGSKSVSFAPLSITAKDVEGKPYMWLKAAGDAKKGDSLCCIYWLFVAFTCVLISFTIWLSIQLAHRHQRLMRAKNAERGNNKVRFTFDDIFNSSYQPKAFSVSWIPGEDIYVYRSSNGSVLSFDVTTNNTELLVDKSIFDDLGASRYYVSQDRRYVLLAYDEERLWRHSFYAKFKIYNTRARTRNGKWIDFPSNDTLKNQALQFAGWSPTGHKLSFIYGNNLYYQSSPLSESQQLTFDGAENTIFNGIADWLYEEEILGSHVAHLWSPDAQYICYAKFNDTKVPLFKFTYYGPKSDIYGDIKEFPYPKAGDLRPGVNTRASIYTIDLNDLSSPHRHIPPPEELQDTDHYFTQIVWRNKEHVTIAWTNRLQVRSITCTCHFQGQCSEVHVRTERKGWIDPMPTIRYIDDTSYLTLLPKDEGRTGSWQHVAIIQENGLPRYLTMGEEEVKLIVAYEAQTNIVYYISTNGDPRKRHLFRVGTRQAQGSRHTPECLSCDLEPDCSYVTVQFSSSAKYYVLGCQGPEIPQYWLRSTDGNRNELKEDNAAVAALLQEKALPKRVFLQIPVGGGITAHAEVLIPPGADRKENREKLPLLVQAYGGPGSQSVRHTFSIGYHTYLASHERVVYARIDGRGSGSRGNDFKWLLYRSLATLEVEDQILGGKHHPNRKCYCQMWPWSLSSCFLNRVHQPYVFTRYLKEEFRFIHRSKIGIWGWSYGGFVTSHAVANETNLYTCGISGAALSDRRYYDTAHTERFMGYATPEDNQEGYDRTDVMRKIHHFQNKTFLIVHGTADDNVHFASSAQLVKALTDAEIQFRLQIYPDQAHYFLDNSRHLYRLFTDFLMKECWDLHHKQKVSYVTINISEQFDIV